MPWPLSENLVLSGFPSPEYVRKHYWDNSGVCMITLCKKQIDPEIPGLLDRYVYHPIPDGRMTDAVVARVWEARDIVLSMMSNPGSRITVAHCHAGRNRSALVAGLALQWQYNWTGEETLNWVRDCRPRAIANEHFEVFMRGLGRPR